MSPSQPNLAALKKLSMTDYGEASFFPVFGGNL